MNIRSFQNHTPNIDPSAFVDASAVLIGQVSIGEHASVWPMSVLRGDIHHIEIGAYSNIQDGSVLHVTHVSAHNPTGFSLTIGKYVTVGHQVVLHGCTIGNYCLIGMGSAIIDGAIIPDHVIIGAKSLVPQGKVLESGYLSVGQPVGRVRKLTDKELEFLQYSAQHYAKLAQQHAES